MKPLTVTAKDIMNPEVITVKKEMTVHELACFFADKMISGAPVVDGSGRLIGVVSVTDIVTSDSRRASIVKNKIMPGFYLRGWEDKLDQEEIKNFHVEVDDGVSVGDIMTHTIFEVDEETVISEMADLMIDKRVHRLVVTHEGKVKGIVTAFDMLKTIREFTGK